MKKQIVIYIVILAVLIFFSRTIYNHSLPKVTATGVISGTLHKSLEGYARLDFAKTYDVFSAQDGRVMAVYTAKNEAVDAFAPIVYIENKAEQTEINAAETMLLQKEFALQLLEIEKTQIENDLVDIKNKPDAEHTIDDLEIKALETEIANKKAEAARQFILYRAGTIPQKDYNAAVLAVEDAETQLLQKLAGIQEAKEVAAETKLNDIKSKESELLDIENRIHSAVFDIDIAQTALNDLRKIETQTVTVKDAPGVVVEIYIQEGEYIARGAKIATIGVRNENFITEITESKEKASFINLDDSAEFQLNGASTDAVVTEIKPDGDSLKIKLSVLSELFIGGEYGKVVFEKTTPDYDLLVPNEAVVRDTVGASVWVIKKGTGTLGDEFFVQKIKVFTVDYDENFTAISRGLEPWDFVITNPPEGLAHDNRVIPV